VEDSRQAVCTPDQGTEIDRVDTIPAPVVPDYNAWVQYLGPAEEPPTATKGSGWFTTTELCTIFRRSRGSILDILHKRLREGKLEKRKEKRVSEMDGREYLVTAFRLKD